MLRAKPRRPLACVQRHPFLFTLMTLTAAAELGLTAFLLSAGTEYSIWSSPAYHSLLVLMCFEAAWTVLFSTAYLFWLAHGGTRLLAGVASSVLWLLLTAVLWGTAAGLMHNTHARGTCPSGARCRQSLTVEALGWTEFSLCILTLTTTVMWVSTGMKGRLKDSRTYV